MRILVIEDDTATADYIARGLTQEGHTTQVARTGRDGLFLALSEPFDVVVTDRMLPAPDGVAIVRAMRASALATPVLMLTALDDVARRVEGLDAGADDYLAKPFAFSELYARVRALARRPAPTLAATELVVGGLHMDLLRRVVTRQGAPVELLPTEWRLLEYMMRHPGQVLTRTMLLERVWDFAFDPDHQRGGRACQPPAPQAGGAGRPAADPHHPRRRLRARCRSRGLSRFAARRLLALASRCAPRWASPAAALLVSFAGRGMELDERAETRAAPGAGPGAGRPRRRG